MAKADRKIEKIIEEAVIDAYDEYEQMAGWEITLDENVKVPQECFVKKTPATLLKIQPNDSGTAIKAKIRAGKLTLDTFVEDITLKKKNQQIYIDAYKKWLLGK